MHRTDSDTLVRQARRLAAERLHDESFGAAELADALGITRDHLSRVLRAQRGTGARGFLCRLRLERARLLLRSGRPDSVQQVADAVGYGSASSFSRAYARQWGAPPSADLERVDR
jgi:AraC family carnitine catabolism transcriptional activator